MPRISQKDFFFADVLESVKSCRVGSNVTYKVYCSRDMCFTVTIFENTPLQYAESQIHSNKATRVCIAQFKFPDPDPYVRYNPTIWL
jgi:hypothetical protein